MYKLIFDIILLFLKINNTNIKLRINLLQLEIKILLCPNREVISFSDIELGQPRRRFQDLCTVELH